MHKKNRKHNRQNGYTIIETMIAVSIFLTVVMIGMSVFLNADLVHIKSQDMRSIMDNLSFIMEDISRNMRTGYNYHCGETVSETAFSCAFGGTVFFETATGEAGTSDQWGYKIESSGNLSKTIDGGVNWAQLNPGEVVLESFSGFSVLGAETPSSDNQQPFVIIKLVGTITYKPGTPNSIVTPFSLQTSISQRLVDR